MKKTRFECGHLGLGQFCHRCVQAIDKKDAAKEEKDPEKAKKLMAESDRLFSVPKKKGADTVPMPSDPVPA